MKDFSSRFYNGIWCRDDFKPSAADLVAGLCSGASGFFTDRQTADRSGFDLDVYDCDIYGYTLNDNQVAFFDAADDYATASWPV